MATPAAKPSRTVAKRNVAVLPGIIASYLTLVRRIRGYFASAGGSAQPLGTEAALLAWEVGLPDKSSSILGRARWGSVGRQRREIDGEVFVEQRAGPFFPQKRHGILTFHPQIGQHQSRDQSRSVETHATVRQNFLAVGHQSRPKPRERVQLVQIRQVLIVDGKVDIEHVIGDVWNAQVE